MSTSSHKCAGCRNQLQKKDFLQCVSCKGKYDLDCANVSYKLFSVMQRKDQWKCPECHSKQPKTGNLNTPLRGGNVQLGLPEQMSSTNSRRSPESDPNVTQRVKRHTQFDSGDADSQAGEYFRDVMLVELKAHMTELFNSNLGDLREAITSLTNTISAQNSKIEHLEARLLELENTKGTEKKEISTLNETITQLQQELLDRDQTDLANDLEISGCPEVANENGTHLILSVAQKIGVKLEERDIVSAERVGRKPLETEDGGNRPRPLVVRLTRRGPRDALLRAARVRRDLNTAGLQLPSPDTRLYINERLTKFNRHLFQRARGLARELNYKYTWTRNGGIFVRRAPGKECHRLRTESDLLKVFGKS